MILSHSNHIAYNYTNEKAPWDQLDRMLGLNDYHWCSHHTSDGGRNEAAMMEGFNLLVIDVDGGVKLELVQNLMKEYAFWIHTTKRHTDKEHRFRLIMPLNYILKLNEMDYKEVARFVQSRLKKGL